MSALVAGKAARELDCWQRRAVLAPGESAGARAAGSLQGLVADVPGHSVQTREADSEVFEEPLELGNLQVFFQVKLVGALQGVLLSALGYKPGLPSRCGLGHLVDTGAV